MPERTGDCVIRVPVVTNVPCRLAPGHPGEHVPRCPPEQPCNEWHSPGTHVCDLTPPCHDGVRPP